jgi:hypothetical protein
MARMSTRELRASAFHMIAHKSEVLDLADLADCLSCRPVSLNRTIRWLVLEL